MEKRNYTIVGITPRMADVWEKKFRKDLVIVRNEHTKEITGKISLNVFEAIAMRLGMIKYNLEHPCVLKLISNRKGKHCRV